MSQISTTSLNEWENGRTSFTDAVWDKRTLAAFFGLSVSGINKLIAANKAPPAFRIGRLWRWRRDVVMDWIAANESRSGH